MTVTIRIDTALRDEARQRHAGVLAGEPTVEWHALRDWLKRRAAGGAGKKLAVRSQRERTYKR